MVVGIIGESCTGKSTLADRLKQVLHADVYTGKDYLRLAKNEQTAKALFQKQLEEAVTGSNLIYVIAGQEHLQLLPEGAVRILVTADLQTIQQRFSQRMGGRLPPPVAAMLERKHGCFDKAAHDFHVISGETDLDKICGEIQAIVSK